MSHKLLIGGGSSHSSPRCFMSARSLSDTVFTCAMCSRKNAFWTLMVFFSRVEVEGGVGVPCRCELSDFPQLYTICMRVWKFSLVFACLLVWQDFGAMPRDGPDAQAAQRLRRTLYNKRTRIRSGEVRCWEGMPLHLLKMCTAWDWLCERNRRYIVSLSRKCWEPKSHSRWGDARKNSLCSDFSHIQRASCCCCFCNFRFPSRVRVAQYIHVTS